MSPAPNHRTAPPAPRQSRIRRLAASVPVRAIGMLGGGAAVSVSAYLGAPWWVFLCSVLCTGIASVPAVLPQESEHRRDVLREFLRHRERMYRLRHERPTSRTTGRRTE
ncbi:hypothetical protein GCM10022403_038910 [Streptomyces coacervatus]|uniref:Integral membrane protein n=1 Tax=Streptomyces coacervatus TaxID=647381 RepID=A0ABP7HUU4_9ACTN|nr:hypothetical protein [Streptomyces coacervatus]MDF2270702.1 hypothetical protein [Streptomyces coacervatus]